MKNEINDIKKYNPSSTDSYFFDNNIWMFLFCPLGNSSKKKQQDYSRFLQQIQTCRASIFITSMILSEFANACLRLDYDLWKKEDPRNVNARYKQDYIPTARYKTASKEITSEIKNILRITERTPDNFNSVNMDNILTNFEIIDFNDSYIVEFCRNQSFKLVTDDKDIIKKVEHSSLTIITSV
ncbi:hypothetical protein EZS27_000086 [termite gut metagenome]|uniref:PIN domain-containing protein n=1 Tax=termite gut metagenome TaxID=433724 RepID=A0A5J4T2L7_9ZZZZ